MKRTLLIVVLMLASSASFAGCLTAFAAAGAPNFHEHLSTKASATGTSAVGAGSSCDKAETKAYDKVTAMAEAYCQKEQGQHLDTTTPYSSNDDGTSVSGVGPAATYGVDGCGYFYSTVAVDLYFNCL